jgi:hypothetical protein
MRTFLIFKQKNIRSWKVTDKAINHILSFDRIIKEDVTRLSIAHYI